MPGTSFVWQMKLQARTNKRKCRKIEVEQMNKAESKYFNTAVKMDEALLELLEKKDFDYITVKVQI